jgi:hypothetical protein
VCGHVKVVCVLEERKIVLDLVQPLLAGRCFYPQRKQARLDEVRQQGTNGLLWSGRHGMAGFHALSVDSIAGRRGNPFKRSI